MDYRIIEGDCIEGMRRLEGQSVNCVVTSPPYFGLRQYLFDNAVVVDPSLPDEQRHGRAPDQGRADEHLGHTLGNAQPPIGMDRGNQAIQGRTLRHVSARPYPPVHLGRLPEGWHRA